MSEQAGSEGRANIDEAVARGIALCKQDRWQEGLKILNLIADAGERTDLPGRFYAILGFGRACYQGKLKDGLALCRHAVKLEFYQAENYYWLAQAYSLTNSRRRFLDTIAQGLKIDPENRQLLELRKELDERRPPVLRFLSRTHPLNRALGKLRHQMLELQGGND